MIQRLLQHKMALCRTLTMVAVLAVCGAQMLEAQHNHGLVDHNAECLLCQSLADTSAVQSVPVFELTTENGAPPAAVAVVSPQFSKLHPPARAPPANT